MLSDSTVNNSYASPAAETVNVPTAVYSDSMTHCDICERKLRAGRKVCLHCKSKKNPAIELLNKQCYNCSEVILLPCSMILAPVDDSGTMKELCSPKCLASFNSKKAKVAPKPPPPQCKMCNKACIPQNSKLTLDGFKHTVCGDACFTNYHQVNNLTVVTCDICSSASLHKHFTVKTEEGSKSICTDECLVKFKESVKRPRLCPMCQTSHQMSDMVENKNDEGTLDFFCSNRCMMVHKAQTLTLSGRNSPVCDNEDKQVKPLQNLEFIKQEPIEEECNPNVSSSLSTESIKDEPSMAKEEMKTEESPVLTSSGDPSHSAPTVANTDLWESCSSCRKVLMDGETVYQRKNHTDIFCSSACLLKFYKMKQVKRSCTFCLQALSQAKKVLQAPVDDAGTIKDFCCQTCMSSFNYKSMMQSKVPIVPVASHSQCNICGRYCISKHEIIHKEAVKKICSDPCFLRFCNSNNLSICLNCHSNCNAPLTIITEDGSKRLCSADCLAQYKQKIQTPQSCSTCSTKLLMSDMVDCKNSDGEVELFCNNSCVAAAKILAVSSSGDPVDCDSCGKSSVPACHLAMSDASIRNFCSLSCAMTFKESQRDKHVPTRPAGASQQTQCDFLKPPEKLKCAKCRREMKTTPKVIQNKGRMHFVCSASCSQAFRRDNNIVGKCDYCRNERIVKVVIRVNDKDCYFCSAGCKMLFQQDLKKQWGEYCQSCAYCLSISKTVIVERYGDSDQALCSYDCNLKYNLLFNHFAKCDTCGRKEKLTQSIALIGVVKHFCDMKCLLHFCSQHAQMANRVSPPPRAVSTEESSPVITNVISLAGALAKQTSSSARSAQRGSHTQTLSPAPDIHTKVVGHASVQTVPKELKNKSMLCTPLVHNKGVSCSTQTVDAETQTENSDPKAAVLPSSYVPLSLNMYSQNTSKPLGLPVPEAGHQVHYNLTDQHPDQTMRPHSKDPAANSCPQTLQEIDISESDEDDQQESSDDDDQQESSDILVDSCSTTEKRFSDMDQSHAADSCPQTPQEKDISESYDDDQQERSDGLVDSCSPTEEGLCDMVSPCPEMSEEEVEKNQQEEEKVTLREPSVETQQVTVPSNPEPCIEVKTCSNKTNKRIYDKKSYCLYCEKPYGKIARHLLQKHSDRAEVAKVLTHNKGSAMRGLLLSKVRNMGNYKHNCSVLSSGKGQIVTKKQASHPSSHMDYLPCKFCYAMYIKKDIWKHHKHCKLQVKEDGPCLPVPVFLPGTPDSLSETVKSTKEEIKEFEDETTPRDFSKAVLREHQKLETPAVTLKEEILHCSAMELSDGLCGFIKEVKQPDGAPYPYDKLFYLCLSIQQCLFENGHVENIFSDWMYNKFTTEFTKILKSFKPSISASGEPSCIQINPPLSAGYIHSHVEEEFLWDCKQLGAYSPIVLINTLLFFCSKYLGFTTVEQHHQLSFANIVCRTKTNPDNTKSRFLLCYPPKSINEEESDEDGVPAKKRKKDNGITVMMENAENPLRCPVKYYEFYLSKCSESVRSQPGLFYLQPDRRSVPNSPVWFSSSPLDDSMMEAMLVRILAVRRRWGEDEDDWDQLTSEDQTFIPEEEESE
nr:zinc finger MYM-type protein 4-like [Labrus bergylta]